MPTDTSTKGRSANDPMAGAKATSYDDWFQATPDPWEEITKLEYGADRTFASLVEIQIINAAPSQWPDLEKKLLTALAKSSGKPMAIAFICRQLGLIGGDAAVAPLAKLLVDPATTDAARVALQPNPSPSVNLALRAAAPKLSGVALCGLIGTIAARGDRESLPLLASIAGEPRATPLLRETARSAMSILKSNG